MEIPNVELIVQRTAQCHTDEISREERQQKELRYNRHFGRFQFSKTLHKPNQVQIKTINKCQSYQL